jgi:hypothetical protein
MQDYEQCARPGHNKLTRCVEHKDHEGNHTYGPYVYSEIKMSDQLEEAKTLLIQICPDWVIGDIVTPRPKCCPFHHAAKVVQDAQTLLRLIDQ